MKPKRGKAKWSKGISHGKRKRRDRSHPIEKPPCYHSKWAKSIDCASCLKIEDCYKIWLHDLKRRTG